MTSELDRTIPVEFSGAEFKDVTRQSGIDFKHFNGPRTSQLPEDMGSGASWGDFDRDGWPDLFIANFNGNIEDGDNQKDANAGTSRLYRNNGDGNFTDISQKAGLNIKVYANTGVWGDFDNDGWPDLFITTYGTNKLYRNQGNGKLSDVSEKAGINRASGFWTSGAWGDYDKDGDLDLYVCGYVDYRKNGGGGSTLQYNAEVPASLNPSSFQPISNILYRNNGRGQFVDVALQAGVSNGNGRSLAVTWVDINDDGWQDLYVANDVSDNALFLNNGEGTFTDISYTSLVADYRGAMGIALGDWDNDLDMDLFITHWIAQENALYNNLRAQFIQIHDTMANRIRFMDEADRFGLGQNALQYIGFGTVFLDFDNDSRLDLFVTNGSTFQERNNPEKLVPMKDQIYWNMGSKDGFYPVSTVVGDYFSQSYVGRGAAAADYDRDGDQDLFIVNHSGPGILLNNLEGNRNNWIEIELIHPENKPVQGSVIRMYSGDIQQIRQLSTDGSYLSQNSMVQHFGLGQKSKVDSLVVTWPDQSETKNYNLSVNQILKVVKE